MYPLDKVNPRVVSTKPIAAIEATKALILRRKYANR